jgi:two-component system OmpR family sensor kinase
VSDPRERLRILAHELRSPVAALEALSHAARTTGPADRARLVELAVAAARDIERLLSDPELLSLRVEDVDLDALVRGFARAEVAVDAEGSHHVRADPTRLRQAIANLVANALRHGTRATLAVRERDGRVEVLVTDDGPGVDAGIDPFARGESGAGSTGYGLWLARAIADGHGGTLELVDGARPGARFRLSLPSASA